MLVKNCPEPLEGSEESNLHGGGDGSCGGSSTPHRIKITCYRDDEEDIQQRNGSCKRICAEVEKRKLGDSTLVAHVGLQQSDKFTRTPGSRGRKPLAQPLLHHQKLTAANHKLTEYFPVRAVRRSVRKSKKAVLEERQRDLENKMRCGVEDGLKVRHFPGKGRGVVTTRDFIKGEFVVEYIGELIDQVTAKKREAKYAKDQNAGCYMYYFQHRNQQYCVDATAESDKLGRLVNHSRNGNLATRIVEVNSVPHLVLIAKEDIPTGTEVSYDYGDRSRESIRNHPWLAL